MPTVSNNVEAFEPQWQLSVDDFAKLMTEYKQRSVYEELDLIETWGGTSGVLSGLGSNQESGLEVAQYEREKAARQKSFGVNRIPPKPLTPFFMLMWEAAQDLMLIILMICAVISLILGLTVSEHPEIEWIEGAAIFIAVLIVILITAINNYQKEVQFRKLNAVKDNKFIDCVRGGERVSVSVFELVVGDVLFIQSGDEIPTDCICLDSSNLKIDESSFTGETCSITKSSFEICVQQVQQRQKEIQEATDETRHHVIDSPVVLSGTEVKGGNGYLLVVAVGENSQLGALYEQLNAEEESTPLQQKLEHLGRKISVWGSWAAGLTLLALLVSYWGVYLSQAEDQRDSGGEIGQAHIDFLITAALWNGAKKSEWSGTRPPVEGVSAEGEETGETVAAKADSSGRRYGGHTGSDDFLPGGPLREAFVENVALNATAYLSWEEKDAGVGKNVKKVKNCGYEYDSIRKEFKHEVLFQDQFSSEKKRMVTAIKWPAGNSQTVRVLVKGAAERVVRLCTQKMSSSGDIRDLNPAEILKIEKDIIEKMAKNGLRTICLAYRDLNPSEEPNWQEEEGEGFVMERDLVCLGITGIRDPVRDEVPHAVSQCHKAGINVRMVTGDNIETAKQIARTCGIFDESKGHIAMLGKDFYRQVGGVICAKCRTECCDCPRDKKSKAKQKSDDAEDDKKINTQNENEETAEAGDKQKEEGGDKKDDNDKKVLARSQPHDKYALVTGLKKEGKVVAVTGDGTNDAPALKKADVGFAMNIAGKEVAKQAADIILLDDNFRSIVSAVMWGRNTYDNIQRFLQFQLTVNIVAVATVFVSALVLRSSPLSAVHLLWLNLIMDSLGSIALATEPPNERLLDRLPVKRDEFLITKMMWRSIVGQAIYQFSLMMILVTTGEQWIPESEDAFDLLVGNLSDQQKIELSDALEETQGTRDLRAAVYSDFGNGEEFVRSGREFVYFSNEKDYKPVGEGLSPVQWAICLALGAGSLLWHLLLHFLPLSLFCSAGKKEVDPQEAPPTLPEMLRGRGSCESIKRRLSMQNLSPSPARRQSLASMGSQMGRRQSQGGLGTGNSGDRHGYRTGTAGSLPRNTSRLMSHQGSVQPPNVTGTFTSVRDGVASGETPGHMGSYGADGGDGKSHLGNTNGMPAIHEGEEGGAQEVGEEEGGGGGGTEGDVQPVEEEHGLESSPSRPLL
uniref:P-type Cu(+) transporter n=1 Tax=Chromera velia CCMP2878 TaxID=1169474 RepID=A0A0G4HNE1_9ALVE|eukprot:Cvel_7638.t1-p1 / transcript=Cvel_7638.t1 / gene=Cvel_7638 / organism=Chromera_velia_CCMP2878 / gene_product=Putative calcium-transporting ATPase 11, plasma, putative / transcript_product=Putative calcium-transporting ATPase 11, plasma, putative / location=Cvel_scaffold403:79350-91303(-) / protein_length=1189 / sequence_SO=supercontig / SO=protein_coding / is_pseudo=false